MSFQKAADFLRLAELASARYQGVSLTGIEEEFRVDRRTAQRMTKALEEMFPHCLMRVSAVSVQSPEWTCARPLAFGKVSLPFRSTSGGSKSCL